MSRFTMIVAHYLKRATRDLREIILLLIIPIGLVIFQGMIGGEVEGVSLNGYNILASHAAPAMLLSFQFFNGFFMFLFLYEDFRGARRWRLLAAPCHVRSFVFPAFIANWILSIAIGVVVVIISALFMNVYWGNLLVLAVVIALVSLLSTFVSMLIFLFTSRKGQANGVGYIISFGLMVLSGFMIPLQLLGDNAVVRFLLNYGTPLSLGTSAIINSGELSGIFEGMAVFFPGANVGGDGMTQSIQKIGILAAVTLVFGLVTVIAARRRKI